MRLPDKLYFLQSYEIEVIFWLKRLQIYFSVSLFVPIRVVKPRTNINNAGTLFLVRFIITYKITYLREPGK